MKRVPLALAHATLWEQQQIELHLTLPGGGRNDTPPNATYTSRAYWQLGWAVEARDMEDPRHLLKGPSSSSKMKKKMGGERQPRRPRR